MRPCVAKPGIRSLVFPTKERKQLGVFCVAVAVTVGLGCAIIHDKRTCIPHQVARDCAIYNVEQNVLLVGTDRV